MDSPKTPFWRVRFSARPLRRSFEQTAVFDDWEPKELRRSFASLACLTAMQKLAGNQRTFRGPKTHPKSGNTAKMPQSGKSKWGLSNGGLRPLSAICAQSSTIVHFCGLFGPLSEGNFRHKMTTIVGNRGQLWTSTLSPHLESPHLDFPDWVARAIRNAIRANRFARIIRNSNPYFYSTSGRFAWIVQISDSRESGDSRESCESIRANHATKKNTFTRTFSKSSHELLPSCLWHESGTQRELFRKTCSDDFFILGGFFRVDLPPVKKKNESRGSATNNGVV